MTAHPRILATTYFDSWKAKDFETLRSILADDVTFRGALGTADGADACLEGLRGMSRILSDIVIQRMVVEGDDVMTWFDLHSTVAPPCPTVNWSHVEDGRIAEIHMTFDPRELLKGMGR